MKRASEVDWEEEEEEEEAEELEDELAEELLADDEDEARRVGLPWPMQKDSFRRFSCSGIDEGWLATRCDAEEEEAAPWFGFPAILLLLVLGFGQSLREPLPFMWGGFCRGEQKRDQTLTVFCFQAVSHFV